MPLPPQVDAQIRARFELLISEATSLLASFESDEAAGQAHHDRAASIYDGDALFRQDPGAPPAPTAGSLRAFTSLRTRAVSLVELLSARAGDHPSRIVAQLGTYHANAHGMQQMVGVLAGIFDDYKAGTLQRLSAMIEAEVSADYLGQAEALLAEKHTGVADRVPAAVLAGAVLEAGLRTLSQRQTPPIALVTQSGGPKMLNGLIDDLKTASVYNELQAKDLRVWASIRNAAAHGKFDDFDRGQVERMLEGVRSFLTRYL